MIDVLEHLPMPLDSLSVLVRLLVPGGKLIVFTGDTNALSWRIANLHYWYSALPELKAASAATVQLSVPVLAAAGGILFLGESITVRFLLASIAVLGGIALVVTEKTQVVLPD